MYKNWIGFFSSKMTIFFTLHYETNIDPVKIIARGD